jgi:hypothetical protein
MLFINNFFQNKCNDGLLDDDDDDDDSFIPLHAQIPTSRPIETTTTTETAPTTIPVSSTTEQEGTSLSDETFIITSSPINVLPEVAALEAVSVLIVTSRVFESNPPLCTDDFDCDVT